MAPSKRPPPPVVDLTGDPPRKAARSSNGSFVQSSSQHAPSSKPYHSTPPSSSLAASQQGPRSSWAEVSDDEENVDYSQTPQMEFYGTMETKIVGVRYYSGVVTPGESIICRREAGNPYDSNAIRIDNVMGSQIGHLSRNVVTKLARYIDRHGIVLEGVLNGHKGAFDCPIRLYFYGPSDPSARLPLEEKLKADKILKATELKNTRKEAEAQRAVAMGLKNGTPAVGLGSSQEAEQEDFLQNSEEIDIREDLSALDVFAMDEDTLSRMPMATQPDAVESKLLPYQLQGLAWMTAKENPQLPPPGSNDVVQMWKRNGQNGFKNIVSSHVTNDRPALASGGLLCDDMGLGKTLQIISLILTIGFDDGPTLLIAPAGVMSNWEQQMYRHVKVDEAPRVLRYHRQKGGQYSPQDFLKYDVVITSYGKLIAEFTVNDKQGLFSMTWRRVVLDEGHKIRNAATKAAQAACILKAKSRWVLTGTPIVNDVFDFLSYLRFLRITGGVEQKALFSNKIGQPLKDNSGDKNANQSQKRTEAQKLFQFLVQDLCLRRKKDMRYIDLKLPDKKEFLHRVTFTEREKEKYNTLLSKAQEALRVYEKGKNKRKRGSQPAVEPVKFAGVLEQLLRLRQMCCHWSMTGSHVTEILQQLDDQELVDFTDDNQKILQEALLEANNSGEECPICYDAISMHKPVITACKHRFGMKCVTEAIKRNGSCPMCRQKLIVDQLLELEVVDPKARADEMPNTHSSKTDHLERIVEKHLADPKSKVVIFSQWTKFLDIIECVLAEAGHNSVRLEGCMTISQRDKAIEALNTDPDTRIMLVSLQAASVGVNLVGADTVILADCWWAPAIEDQAVDRVHRLGQERPVTVYKFVVEQSVEYRVLKIQAEKRQLVALAFQEKDGGQKKETLSDIQRLLSSTPDDEPAPGEPDDSDPVMG
ncbi:Uu.00g009190.m01.CDS01 [Anthostomella pinea]|uniref:Uu.00g009190.m01.CDS01 n=1 Tax=Anthostomella pinea TaxID=933095 RepID=A0AAI8YPZ6_9PEZI|nr:Uu.00g009190.m01.CDS01 [Anthostomella pinea]